jgi:hypothetical protein
MGGDDAVGIYVLVSSGINRFTAREDCEGE